VGLVKDAGWQYVKTWLYSLRGSGYSGEIALLTVHCEPDLYEQCAKHGVRTFEIDPEELLLHRSEDIFATRHLPLSRVIREAYSDRFALVADVRDVFFQRDPFEHLIASYGESGMRKLFVSEEEARHDRGVGLPGRWNAGKMEAQFSKRIRAEMEGLPVYNAGIVAGPGVLVADVSKMIHLMCLYPRNPGDQAALNAMLRLEPYKSCSIVVTPEDGWVAHFAAHHFGEIPEERRPKIEDGLVRTPEGKVFAILHQHDRSPPEVQELISARVAALESGAAAVQEASDSGSS
jgi:hypothetical protein